MRSIIFLIVLFFSFDVYSAVGCRSYSVAHKFEKLQGYPRGRKGYVIDHICPLAGNKTMSIYGLDIVSNMQYQSIADGKIKDKVERKAYGIRKWCNELNSSNIRTAYNCKKPK